MHIPTTSTELLSVENWLHDYLPDSSLFASPSCSLLAQGTASYSHADNHDGRLLERVNGLLEQAANTSSQPPICLGAVPFNPNKSSFFRVPQSYQLSGPLQRPQHAQSQLSSNQVVQHHLLPSGEDYEKMVATGLKIIADTDITKLVLARRLLIQLHQPLDRRTVLHNMLHSNPHGYTYALPLCTTSPQHDPETFLGASPELLVQRTENLVYVNPLAGTCARHACPQTDQEQAQQLLHSSKDRHEHALVIDDVIKVLSQYCTDLEIPDGPSLTSTRNLWHLSTRIRGRLKNTHTSSLELALAMHPTPAVCGTPTLGAMSTIEQLEPFERQFFAGALGWMDQAGNGEWAVAIRCAHYQQRQLTLSAGAGIVAGSDPRSERIETGNKLMTLLNALGLSETIHTL